MRRGLQTRVSQITVWDWGPSPGGQSGCAQVEGGGSPPNLAWERLYPHLGLGPGVTWIQLCLKVATPGL